MYNDKLYDIDATRLRGEAAILNGAYLYRLASITHCKMEDVLSGRGTLKSRDRGRFHMRQQQISYCANNVLVTFAEVLFHMYDVVLRRLGQLQPTRQVREAVRVKRCLAIFRVRGVSDLILLDSETVQIEFDPRIRGATVVYPAATYEVFLQFNDKVREVGKKGIVYPSARHSRDHCFALFDDETEQVDATSFTTMSVELSLIREDQNFNDPVQPCNPYEHKLHATMGHYRVLDNTVFAQAKADRIINPPDLPSSGYIDFVRRLYRTYPAQAVCPNSGSSARGTSA